ncbi:MAG: hypothetical protein ACE5EA_07800, partial [Nitrospirota bacterium]
QTNARIDTVRENLTRKMDYNNLRLDRLYEVIVRREEHTSVVERVGHVEIELKEVKKKLAMV